MERLQFSFQGSEAFFRFSKLLVRPAQLLLQAFPPLVEAALEVALIGQLPHELKELVLEPIHRAPGLPLPLLEARNGFGRTGHRLLLGPQLFQKTLQLAAELVLLLRKEGQFSLLGTD